jgi:hypothetical protein
VGIDHPAVPMYVRRGMQPDAATRVPEMKAIGRRFADTSSPRSG